MAQIQDESENFVDTTEHDEICVDLEPSNPTESVDDTLDDSDQVDGSESQIEFVNQSETEILDKTQDSNNSSKDQPDTTETDERLIADILRSSSGDNPESSSLDDKLSGHESSEGVKEDNTDPKDTTSDDNVTPVSQHSIKETPEISVEVTETTSDEQDAPLPQSTSLKNKPKASASSPKPSPTSPKPSSKSPKPSSKSPKQSSPKPSSPKPSSKLPKQPTLQTTQALNKLKESERDISKKIKTLGTRVISTIEDTVEKSIDAMLTTKTHAIEDIQVLRRDSVDTIENLKSETLNEIDDLRALLKIDEFSSAPEAIISHFEDYLSNNQGSALKEVVDNAIKQVQEAGLKSSKQVQESGGSGVDFSSKFENRLQRLENQLLEYTELLEKIALTLRIQM